MATSPSNPSIVAPESGQSYAMTEDQAEEELLTIEWSAPDYGFASAPSYIIEMDQAGDNFEDPTQIATVNGTSYSIIVADMNNMLLSQGFLAETEASLEFRVTASLSDSLETQVSEPINLSFTPYRVEVNYPKIYVPGSYQGASGYESNWTPSAAPALASVNSDDNYEGYVYMANSGNEFKFTNEPNWDNGDYGDNDADGTLDPGGANIVAADAGYYKLNVNLNDLTYTMLNTQWGVIGSATPSGWDSDTDMSYDPETKVWTVNIQLTAAEIKFRANDAWDLDYGDNGADGTLNQGGDNITIDQAGNYTIKLDLSTSPYTYTLTQN